MLIHTTLTAMSARCLVESHWQMMTAGHGYYCYIKFSSSLWSLQKIYFYWFLSTCRWYKYNQNGILACSALKKAYRRVLLTGNEPQATSELEDNCLLVLLHGPVDTLAARLSGRKGHFMPPSLLESQLSQLEVPDDKEQCLQCDITKSVNEIVSQITDRIKLRTT